MERNMIMHTRLDAIALATATGSAKQPRRSTVIGPQRVFELGQDRTFDPSSQNDQHRLRRPRKTSESWIDEEDDFVRVFHRSRNLDAKANHSGVRKFRLSGQQSSEGFHGSKNQSGHRRIRTTA
jgi:hypothetical protein